MNPYRYRVVAAGDAPQRRPGAAVRPARAGSRAAPGAPASLADSPRGTEGVYRDSYGYAELTPDGQPRDWSREDIEDFLARCPPAPVDAPRLPACIRRRRAVAADCSSGCSASRPSASNCSPELSAGLADLKLTLGFDIHPDTDG